MKTAISIVLLEKATVNNFTSFSTSIARKDLTCNESKCLVWSSQDSKLHGYPSERKQTPHASLRIM